MSQDLFRVSNQTAAPVLPAPTPKKTSADPKDVLVRQDANHVALQDGRAQAAVWRALQVQLQAGNDRDRMERWRIMSEFPAPLPVSTPPVKPLPVDWTGYL